MNANEILNEYLNLEIAKTLTNIVNTNGEPYLSLDWIYW